MIFHESTKSIFFQNIKIKLNSRTWMTLKSSVVIFQTLEPLQPQWPLQPQQPPWPQWPLQPHFIKNITDCDGWIIPGTKMTNTGPFLLNESSKIQFFTDISTISVGGCWGQPMLLFWKMIDETQISKPPEATIHHDSRNYGPFYPSEPFTFAHFNMRHPVNQLLEILWDFGFLKKSPLKPSSLILRYG